MYFYLTGIDYRSAPINVREKIYRSRNSIEDFWSAQGAPCSAALITCNRLEVYAASEDADTSFARFGRFNKLFPEFARYAYSRYGEKEVFRHLVRLAAGLESQIKGEAEISIQLEYWTRGIGPGALRNMVEAAIVVSKTVRSGAGLDNPAGNIAALILRDIKDKLGCKERYRVVIVGTGKVAELFASARTPPAALIFTAHKNYDRASLLAERSGGEALLPDDLPRMLDGIDAIACATSSPHYVITKDRLKSCASGRTRKLYIYDLSVPRGVDPLCHSSLRSSGTGQASCVVLRNMDDLNGLFDRYNKSIDNKVKTASAIADDLTKTYQEAGYGG